MLLRLSLFLEGEVYTVRSRYNRQLIRLNMKKKWPTRTGMEDSRPIFFCKRFSHNENALYVLCCVSLFASGDASVPATR